MNAADQIDTAFNQYEARSDQVDNELEALEPWDVALRPQAIHDRAKRDGVDLYVYERITGRDPHPFQTGYMLSCKPQRGLICGSRTGKSYIDLMDGLVMITHVIPYSMRYGPGVDTSVKRIVSRENIRRWGRRCISTGELIDHNERAMPDPREWDCGNIIGVGEYPQEKLSPPGSQLWLGTGAQHFQNFWKPRLWPGAKCLVPEGFIDTRKGDAGYHVSTKICHFNGDRDLHVITFESKSRAYEAEEAWFVKFDEENPDAEAFPAAVSHATYFSQAETPYRGLTYTKDYFFPDSMPEERDIFHAIATDSPYRNRKKLESDRKVWKPWDIVAREYGFHSEVRGEPYFDRIKLNSWLQHLKEIHHFAILVPDRDVSDAKDAFNARVDEVPAPEDNERTTWRIYEKARRGVGYAAAIDIAEGDEGEDGVEAQDKQAVVIGRLPLQELNETRPVIAATLRSTLDTVSFATVSSVSLARYNNAVLGAETQRGYFNGIFASELRTYPYWYHMPAVSDKTGKVRNKPGVDTNAKTRNIFFDLIDKWIRDFEILDDPMIYDKPLLAELNGAVRGKGGRCDHLSDGTLDTAMAFGIFLYIVEYSPHIFRDNRRHKAAEPPYAKWRNLASNKQHELSRVSFPGQGLQRMR
jgi:hypothetical protein